MRVLVTYDVSTMTAEGQRRLRRVARACADYGQRVQKSVFECQVGPTEWALLRQRLLAETNLNEDSLRVYFLDVGIQIEHYGVGLPRDLEEPLII